MKDELAAQKREKNIAVKLVPAELLTHRKDELDEIIAQRAYRLFEGRGFQHGRDVEDWLQAENEVVHWCRHDLRESDRAVILRAEMPSSYPADRLLVSVEPRRLTVSGEREIEMGYSEGMNTGTKMQSQRIFRAHDLSVEVNPAAATATLRENILEVVMPKAGTSTKPEARRSASSGG